MVQYVWFCGDLESAAGAVWLAAAPQQYLADLTAPFLPSITPAVSPQCAIGWQASPPGGIS